MLVCFYVNSVYLGYGVYYETPIYHPDYRAWVMGVRI